MRRVDALFARYGESHRNPANKAIHWVCVPLITWCVIAFFWAWSPVGRVRVHRGRARVLRVAVAHDRDRDARRAGVLVYPLTLLGAHVPATAAVVFVRVDRPVRRPPDRGPQAVVLRGRAVPAGGAGVAAVGRLPAGRHPVLTSARRAQVQRENFVNTQTTLRARRRRALLAVLVALPTVGIASSAALVAAAEAGDTAMLRRLLDAGAAIDLRDTRGRTALLAATHANRVDAARLLIERGADVNAKDAIQDSPFLYAGAEGRVEILRLTLAAGADLTSTNRFGGTALIPAAHHGHVATVRELLKTKIAVDHVNRLGWTALLEAIILGDGGAAHTEIVRLLVAHGADVSLPMRRA